ncbi:hypothetical protein UCRPA7_7519 [Phaeoacremonium minimum UCRPA7]|uniref:Uncharacterized protein n=1 Tax=Phaeoacremonium minimum (strain UCR-PA7) TaxID=1286976 RepID=R8BCD6_PHAM7|nr:hypothetical protein UCRPA7_7519 [Phaeoacremonium minimum UCRPA7]EON96963.1 hypothetical protein UCRPA7_7519 [Phaeoacremonium minimum UCRPA7]
MALQPASQDRVNQLRDSALFSSVRGSDARDSSVHDKIHQFNSLAVQSKQLERKTADAALKRAMLGREEAESEMRRYRDEARQLRKQVEEGRERERKVGERLETVMENYGRAKETHAHTQALWEKEIRRARKETFKSQSVIVKLQEELKSARSAQKSAEETLEREKERSQAREQEAFSARYGLVGVQQQLDEALEKIKVVEQERDAFKTLAKTEEDVARIAAEGKLPLPPSENAAEDDEFASPKKRPRVSSLTVADVKSSASSEAEIEELTRLWQWEKQRADRASDHLEYLEAECHLRACPCMQNRPRSSTLGSKRQKRPERIEIADPSDRMILGEAVAPVEDAPTVPSPTKTELEAAREEPMRELKEEPRRGTIFLPEQGIFRTVSMEEAAAIEAAQAVEDDVSASEPPTPMEVNHNPPFYARTPSVEPPAFALLAQERASLASLLEAPHQREETPVFNIPTTPGPVREEQKATIVRIEETVVADVHIYEDENRETIRPISQPHEDEERTARELKESFNSRPHTAAAFYREATTTTKVPIREETEDPSMAKRLLALQRTPSNPKRADEPTFDINNPALTPTMTRSGNSKKTDGQYGEKRPERPDRTGD